MSWASKERKKAGYEKNIPRCGNCKHYKAGFRVLVNSIPRTMPIMCKKHNFSIATNSICDHWESKDGEKLE